MSEKKTGKQVTSPLEEVHRHTLEGAPTELRTAVPDQLGTIDEEAVPVNEHLLLIEAIEVTLEGAITSKRIRLDEDPPSAAWHILLDGKRYILILQPSDMPDVGSQR